MIPILLELRADKWVAMSPLLGDVVMQGTTPQEAEGKIRKAILDKFEKKLVMEDV